MTVIKEAKAIESLLAAYAEFERTDAARSAWLNAVRKDAIAAFEEMGFPTLQDEEWRFTSVAPIANTTFESATPGKVQLTTAEIEQFLFGAKGALLVFVNGRFDANLSQRRNLPDNIIACSLADAMDRHRAIVEKHLARVADHREHGLIALNTAMIRDGAFIHIPREAIVREPIHVLYLSTPGDRPSASHPRTLIVAEPFSQATLVETYAAPAESVYLTNAVTEIVAEENAVIDHYKVERESDNAFHVHVRQLRQARSSSVSSHTLSFGGGLVRNDINTVLDGENANCVFNGLYVQHGEQHVDNHLRVDHAKPHCNSWEYFKGILSDKSKAVFTGRIIVRKDAQKTDAKQSNANLLLSEEASIDTKPQLEILADDVKCTHGATVGQVDDEAVFYLRSRGVPLDAARSLLVYAFAGESIGQVRIPALRDKLQDLLAARLAHGESLTFGRPFEYSDDFGEIVRAADQRRHTS